MTQVFPAEGDTLHGLLLLFSLQSVFLEGCLEVAISYVLRFLGHVLVEPGRDFDFLYVIVGT